MYDSGYSNRPSPEDIRHSSSWAVGKWRDENSQGPHDNLPVIGLCGFILWRLQALHETLQAPMNRLEPPITKAGLRGLAELLKNEMR